jgi:glutamate dehydrogenase (NADP+)
VEEMLKIKKTDLKNKVVTISGSGNVAQYAVEKCNHLGAKVVTMSDSSGWIYDPDGIDEKKLEYIIDLKNVKRGRIKDYADKYKATYQEQSRPWEIKCDIAIPCATQNELDGKDAQKLVDNGVIVVCEAANMPATIEAQEIIHKAGVLFGPGKAANAGGVATSGLEMVQNSQRYFWTAEEVDARLRQIMSSIHRRAYVTAELFGQPCNYVLGANIAGFLKVADAMVAQGHTA